MKDNKYQELMSHITMTPDMEKRVMEAVEAEIEEEEAIRDEGIILQKDDESIPGIPPVPKAREGDYRRQAKKEGAKKKNTKTSRIFRVGGIAAAACLILILGIGTGIMLGSGRNNVSSSHYADNSNNESNQSWSGAAEAIRDDDDMDYADGEGAYEEEYAEEEINDEDSGYMPAQVSSAEAGGGSVSANSAGGKQEDQEKSKDKSDSDSSGLTGDEAQKDDKNLAEKLVYTCTVTVETENYRDSIKDIRESIKKCNGFIESEYEYGDASGYDYSSEVYEAKDTEIKHNKLIIRIPMDHYESFVSGMSAFGNVTEKNQDVENITKSYQDTETRIKALKTQENRLLEMMKKAETISDMITVEDRLTEVQSELEYYQNNLNTMDNKVNYGTVELSIHQVSRYTESPEISFGQKAKNRFEDGINVIAGFFRGLALVIVFLAPILPIFLVLAFIIFLIIRGVRKKKRRISES